MTVAHDALGSMRDDGIMGGPTRRHPALLCPALPRRKPLRPDPLVMLPMPAM